MAAEINDILAQPMPGMEIDEGELDAELDMLDADCLDESLMGRQTTAVPQTAPQQMQAPPQP